MHHSIIYGYFNKDTVSFLKQLRFFCFSITTTVTHGTDFEVEQDPFTVCLLATDKEDETMYKLVGVNVVNGEERTITAVPYSNNCAMIFVAGNLADVCFFLDRR